jgi:predicted sulfurtransferase
LVIFEFDYFQVSFGSTMSMASVYFQGKNYLFDSRINVFVMDSDSGEVTDLGLVATPSFLFIIKS